MTKYDWSKVPDEINWIATDESGYKSGYICKPKCEFYDIWEGNGWIELGYSEFKGYWKNSLEERPK